jgi:hypothetical protein
VGFDAVVEIGDRDLRAGVAECLAAVQQHWRILIIYSEYPAASPDFPKRHRELANFSLLLESRRRDGESKVVRQIDWDGVKAVALRRRMWVDPWMIAQPDLALLESAASCQENSAPRVKLDLPPETPDQVERATPEGLD